MTTLGKRALIKMIGLTAVSIVSASVDSAVSASAVSVISSSPVSSACAVSGFSAFPQRGQRVSLMRGTPPWGVCCGLFYRHSALLISEGMRQSPRGDRLMLPTLGPSGTQLRLYCCAKNRRVKAES